MTDNEFHTFLWNRRWKIFACDEDESLGVSMYISFGNRYGSAWKNFWSEAFMLANNTLSESVNDK